MTKKILFCFIVIFITILSACTSTRNGNLNSGENLKADDVSTKDEALTDIDTEESRSIIGAELKFDNKDADFVYKIKNTTDFPLTVQGYLRDKDCVTTTKKIVIQKGQTYEFKYKLSDIISFAKEPSEEIMYLGYKFIIAPKGWSIEGMDYPILKNKLEYNKNQFYSVSVVTGGLHGFSVKENIDDYDYYPYDEMIPGDGKSPVKLQLRNRKEFIEADWSYPRLHKEVPNPNGGVMMSSSEWQRCATGKEENMIFNYNPNNGYYMIGGKYPKELIRPYTVEELNILIGVKPYTQAELESFSPDPK